jgi:glycosyltransferase involved in cell wall biosynthesis
MSGILLYVSFHYPLGGGTAAHRTARLARHLSRLGWDVVVLCGPPDAGAPLNGPLGFRLISVGGAPAGAPAPPPASPARAAPDRPSRLRVILRQIAFLPDPQIYWIPSALKAARRAIDGARVGAVLCSAPPFSVFLLGRTLKFLWKVPLVLDYRDVWQDHPWWPAPRWRRPPEAWMERRLLAAADLVVANHESMQGSLRARSARIADRCIVVPNGYDRDELGTPVRPAWRRGERFEIVYAGTLYGPVADPRTRSGMLSVQEPEAFFDALKGLADRGVFAPGGVRVTFVGAKPSTSEKERLERCAAERGVAKMVQVLSRMEKPAVVPLLRRAHLLLNILYYTEAQVAQKVYDYLHLEIPILSLLRQSDVNATIVRQARAGPIVDPADTAAISDAIEGVVRAYESGRHPIASDRAFIDRFDAAAQARTLDARLRVLIPPHLDDGGHRRNA